MDRAKEKMYMYRVRESCTWTGREKAVHGHGQKKLTLTQSEKAVHEQGQRVLYM